MTYRTSWRHERILRRPKDEDRLSARTGDGQEPSRPHLLRQPFLRKTLRQTRPGGPPAGAQEEARLEAQDRRASQQAARRGRKGAPFRHSPTKARVSALDSLSGGEPLHRVPSHKAHELDQEKGGRSAQEREELVRAAWGVMVAGALDPRRLVFVDECGTHTSLAPVYGYCPKGERLSQPVPRNLKARTRPCWRA
jgi:hypothetical protein